MTGNPAKEETRRSYLDELFSRDLTPLSLVLELDTGNKQVVVPLLRETYVITPGGIINGKGEQPSHAVSVLLLKYCLTCPETLPPEGEWITYREFRDAAPFAAAFSVNTEQKLTRYFSGKMDLLDRSAALLGGEQTGREFPYDRVSVFHPLGKVPVMLCFNDADEEFPARAGILFRESAPRFLDMESLAIAGWLLSDRLLQSAGFPVDSVM